jgi:signal transduction histidine kinase
MGHCVPGQSSRRSDQLPIVRIVDELNNLADEALREIRTTSYLLHPPLLDEVGFAFAARWFVDGFAMRSNIEVQLQIAEPAERLARNCELALFRVLQESLTNVSSPFESLDRGCNIHDDRQPTSTCGAR